MNSEITEKHIDHILLTRKGKPTEPAVVFFVAIHGNEPAGLLAFNELENWLKKIPITGSLYVLLGNQEALEQRKRFISVDLNRIWTHHHIEALRDNGPDTIEEHQQRALLERFDEMVSYHKGPMYFIDFHTTSSESPPFITINDALINRKFSHQYPVPIILGIEEYLDGPLLSYINQLGFVSLGFESGQHDERISVDYAKAFMALTLVYSGLISETELKNYKACHELLMHSKDGMGSFYEVVARHGIEEADSFTMAPGFKSFQTVKKGTLLAHHNGSEVKAPNHLMVFMPLYQKQGEEGFFEIRKTPRWALWLSEKLRKFRLDRVLTWLPGVRWADASKSALVVNLRVARFLARQVFHLLGYRHRQADETHMKLYNRERKAQVDRYANEKWYRM